MYYDCGNWHDFTEHVKTRRLILFGAGRLSKKFISSHSGNLEIDFIVDNNPQLWGTTLYDIPIYHVSKLKEYPFDGIIVLMCGPGHEMMHELKTMGIDCCYDYALIEKNKYFDNVDLNLVYNPKYSFDYSWVNQANSRYAHALGTIDNYMYTNSLEAFEYNYKLGFRAFESDIFRIDDGTLLLSHEVEAIRKVDKNTIRVSNNTLNSLFGGRPWSITDYRNEKVFGKYTPLTTSDFIKLMSKYPDIFWITHTYHDYPKDIYSVFKQLTQEATETDISVLDRFIIQVYDEYMLDIVMSIYPFKCANLLQYQGMTNNQPFNNNIDTCLKTGIKTVTLPVSRLNKEVIEYFKKYNIFVCAYAGIYGEKDINKYREMGAEIFCVDNFVENAF